MVYVVYLMYDDTHTRWVSGQPCITSHVNANFLSTVYPHRVHTAIFCTGIDPFQTGSTIAQKQTQGKIKGTGSRQSLSILSISPF